MVINSIISSTFKLVRSFRLSSFSRRDLITRKASSIGTFVNKLVTSCDIIHLSFSSFSSFTLSLRSVLFLFSPKVVWEYRQGIGLWCMRQSHSSPRSVLGRPRVCVFLANNWSGVWWGWWMVSGTHSLSVWFCCHLWAYPRSWPAFP